MISKTGLRLCLNHLVLPGILLLSMAPGIVSAQNIQTNSAVYSAGNMKAEEIDSWFAQNFPPSLYDIWGGRKEKIHLNGAWKAVKLAANEANDRSGESNGFWKSDFDDSQWFNQPVPWCMDFKFPASDNMHMLSWRDTTRTDWFRKHFSLVKPAEGRRVILHFEGINEEGEFWLNDRPLGKHRNLPSRFNHAVGMRNESFEFDVTDLVRYDRENILAARISFAIRNAPKFPGLRNHPPLFRGIWQEVYLEIRPPVYVRAALITPDLKNGSINIRAFIVNTGTDLRDQSLAVAISPWQSDRYQPPRAAPATHARVGVGNLAKGTNEACFSIKLDDPVCWSPEQPFLYLAGFFDGDTLIGQERFGFREVTIGEDAFYLNGRKIYFRAEQFNWAAETRVPAPQRGLFYLNYGRSLEHAIKLYLAENLNLTRLHSTQYTRAFYNLADEMGLLVYDEENVPEFSNERIDPIWFDGTNVPPFFAGKVRTRLEAGYNHPSVILHSLGNELYDTFNKDGTIWNWPMYLNPLRREWKHHDTSRPLTPSSGGRPPTLAANAKLRSGLPGAAVEYVETDFHDMHNYYAGLAAVILLEDDEIEGGYKKCYLSFQEDHPGKKMAVLNGEMGFTGYFPWRNTNYIDGSVIQGNRIARDVLAARKLEGLCKSVQGMAVGQWGILNTALDERARIMHAETYRQMIEQHRRKRQWVAGFVCNTPADYLANPTNKLFPIPDPAVYPVVQKACQPVLACLDGLYDRNLLTGKKWAIRIYLMNDKETPITNPALEMKITGPARDALVFAERRASLDAGAMAVIPFNALVPDLPGGHYRAELTVRYEYGGKSQESRNDYPLYILGQKDRAKKIETTKRIGLFRGNSRKPEEKSAVEKGFDDFAAILKQLQVPYRELSDFDSLDSVDVLIVPSFGVTEQLRRELKFRKAGQKLDEWVTKGGRLVYAEQRFDRETGGVICLNWRYFTEIIVQEHPLFAGLEIDDFRYWNGDSPGAKSVCEYGLVPIANGLLATSYAYGATLAMSIAEYALGKGVVLRSQVKAPERYGTDGVATRYMDNLLHYILGPEAGKFAAPMGTAPQSGDDAKYQLDASRVCHVNLRSFANTGFKDETAGDSQGGWSDQGPSNDAREFPTGHQIFQGVPFDIIDPDENNGKAIIALRGSKLSGTSFLPTEIKNIKVDTDVKRLFFLVASAWTPSEKGALVGEITAQYDWAGLAPTSTLKLESGRNIADWFNPAELPEAAIAWRGGNPSAPIGVYLIEWRKPVGDDQKVELIHIRSTQTAVLFVIGITGEK